MHIRPEASADVAAIATVIERAFATLPVSSHTEQYIVRALRDAGALVVSFVAEREREVVGHVAFSPVTISDGSQRWYGLGPLAVEPSFQRQGIGSALVRAGIAQLRAISAAGCVVFGNPIYYCRFGFHPVPGLVYPGPPPEHRMALLFSGRLPQGKVAYHAAFASEA